MIQKVERLKALKEQIELLSKEKEQLELEVEDLVIYKNDDGTWTRFTKTDNIAELNNNGNFWKSTKVTRYSTKIETLKNPPKELKVINE